MFQLNVNNIPQIIYFVTDNIEVQDIKEKYVTVGMTIKMCNAEYTFYNIITKNNMYWSFDTSNELYGEELEKFLFDEKKIEQDFRVFVGVQQKALNSHKKIVKIVSDIPREIKDNVAQRSATERSIILDKGVVFTHVYDNTRHYERRTEAWSVRGHYRHCKSGKVVFIPPFTKGKGEIKDKNYII